MNKILGVYVSSDRNLDQLIKLCRSAKKKGCKSKIVFYAPRDKALHGSTPR